MIEVAHFDLLIIMAIFFSIGIGGLIFLGWMVRDVNRMTRAVAGLVIQETGKLRRD